MPFIFLIFAFLFASVAYGQPAVFTPVEELFLSWGTDDQSVGIKTNAVSRQGPLSFSVNGQDIFILDSQNGKIKIFKEGILTKTIPVRKGSDDILVIDKNHFYILENNTIFEILNGVTINQLPSPGRKLLVTSLVPISYLSTNERGAAVVNDTLTSVISEKFNLELPLLNGVLDGYGGSLRIKKESWRKISISTSYGLSFEINSKNDDLALARFIGRTPEGDLYLYLERIVEHVPLKVSRQISVYSRTGELRGELYPGHNSYTHFFKEFYVDSQGVLHQIISSAKGIYIVAWPKLKGNQNGVNYIHLPDKYQSSRHYNDLLPVPKTEQQISLNTFFDLDQTTEDDFPPVTRTEVLKIADTYVTHQWIASAKNLTDGSTIEDPAGNHVETPSWIKIGENKQIPYCWGCFSSLTEYDEGLLAGKYAGNISMEDISDFAVGVDCSGFVSRSWKLPEHYSTRMMKEWDKIEIYQHWKELKPGDAILKAGHVRLCVSNNENGSIFGVEAGSNDWRVSYRNFNYDELSAYSPAHYLNVTDNPFREIP